MSIAVHIINPGKKKAKKKSAGKKKAKKKPAAKTATRKKTAKKQKSAKKRPQSRRPPQAGATMAKKKAGKKTPAKKRKNPAPKKKARRRKNPTGFGGIATEIKLALPRLIGKVVCAWAVKQFGGMNSGPDYERRSPMLGESWNGRGYMIAAGVAIVAPPLLRRIIGGHTQFRQGVIDLIVEKAVWTEGFARSEWMQGAFGNYGQVAYDPGTGQSYVDQGNDQWSAMQGLVDQSALDGLTERSVLDGPNSYIGPGDSYTQNAHAAYA